jgi:hypothetical protein
VAVQVERVLSWGENGERETRARRQRRQMSAQVAASSHSYRLAGERDGVVQNDARG